MRDRRFQIFDVLIHEITNGIVNMYTRRKTTPSICTQTSQAEDTMRLMPGTVGDVVFVFRGTFPKSLVDLTVPERGSEAPLES